MMLEELFASGVLNLVYAAIALLSFLYALITLIGAEVGDALDFDMDMDVDGDSGVDFISVSPFALAMFGSTFGLVGLITRLWMEMDTVPSVLWSLGAGVIVGALSQAFFLYVLSPSKSSHYSLQDDAIGREAEVITTIPGSGLGEIAFNNVSGRIKLGARSSTGKKIGYGDVVVIERIVGRVAFVRPVGDK
ncbi:MAG: NfeD family protein [Chloroflexota bacterium]